MSSTSLHQNYTRKPKQKNLGERVVQASSRPIMCPSIPYLFAVNFFSGGSYMVHNMDNYMSEIIRPSILKCRSSKASNLETEIQRPLCLH